MENADVMAIAIDAGGTYFKSALVDLNGEIFPGSFIERPSFSNAEKDKIIFAFQGLLREMKDCAAQKNFRVSKIAIDFPGPFDYQRGVCMMRHKFFSLYDLPLKPLVMEIIDDPDVPVTFHHDMHAYTYGAYKYDVGQGYSRVFCVAIGTGLGGGLVLNGQPVMRPDRGAMFPIFSKPYKDDILEDIVSNRGLVNEYRRLTGFEGELDAKIIEQFAEQKDLAALEVYNNMGKVLGEELKEIFEKWDVQCLILGGQISKAYHLFGPALKTALEDSKYIQFIGPLRDFTYISIRGLAALPIPENEDD